MVGILIVERSLLHNTNLKQIFEQTIETLSLRISKRKRAYIHHQQGHGTLLCVEITSPTQLFNVNHVLFKTIVIFIYIHVAQEGVIQLRSICDIVTAKVTNIVDCYVYNWNWNATRNTITPIELTMILLSDVQYRCLRYRPIVDDHYYSRRSSISLDFKGSVNNIKYIHESVIITIIYNMTHVTIYTTPSLILQTPVVGILIVEPSLFHLHKFDGRFSNNNLFWRGSMHSRILVWYLRDGD